MIERLLAGERMLSAGMFDRAEELFEQVAEADPRNSIAVVGLARVALERGDLDGAIRLVRRALEIDHENAAAARMMERLHDVVSTPEGTSTAEPGAAAPSEAAPASDAAVAPPSEAVPVHEPAPVADVTSERDAAAGVPLDAAPASARRSWLARILARFRRR